MSQLWKVSTSDTLDFASQRRGTIEIIIEILEYASGKGATKTALVYKCNLNFIRIKRYLELLTKKGLIERIDHQPVSLYRITKTGEELLKILRDAKNRIYGDSPSDLVVV